MELAIVSFNNGGRTLMAVILKVTRPLSIIFYERQSDLQITGTGQNGSRNIRQSGRISVSFVSNTSFST